MRVGRSERCSYRKWRLPAIRILGVDPGLFITGYGLVEMSARRQCHRRGGTLRTRREADLAERIASLYSDLTELLAELNPTAWPSSSFTPTTSTRARPS